MFIKQFYLLASMPRLFQLDDFVVLFTIVGLIVCPRFCLQSINLLILLWRVGRTSEYLSGRVGDGWGEILRWGKNGTFPRKTPHHPQAELGLSHMWSELGLNPQRWDDKRFRVLKISVLTTRPLGPPKRFPLAFSSYCFIRFLCLLIVLGRMLI